MKLAIISPITHLNELSNLGDIQFALGHVKDLKYIEYYREQAKQTYTIMDNGSYELGKSVSFDDIFEAAEEIKPDEIVAPDVQWNPVESLNLTRHFMKYAHGRGLRDKYKIMVVVWAFDPGDFPMWYKEYLKLNPDVIGIGKWLSTKFLARPSVVQLLKYEHMWKSDIEHHFLGCGFPGEALQLHDEGRSMDTSGPIADAMNGLRYVEGEEYLNLHTSSLKRSLDFNARLTPEQLEIAKANCRIMLDYAHGGK